MSTRALLYYFALTLFALVLTVVDAHFQMIYPPATRGFDESKEPLAPCGGFDIPANDRISMPRASFMTIDSGHVSYSYIIKALYNENPSINDFNAANLRQLSDGTRAYPQTACLPFEFGSDVQDGTKATLQIVYNGGDGLLYQCIDVVVDNTASLNSSMCYNTHGAPPSRTSQVEENATNATSQSNEGSSITASAYFVLLMAIGISVLIL